MVAFKLAGLLLGRKRQLWPIAEFRLLSNSSCTMWSRRASNLLHDASVLHA
jgi:hypothetical protein